MRISEHCTSSRSSETSNLAATDGLGRALEGLGDLIPLAAFSWPLECTVIFWLLIAFGLLNRSVVVVGLTVLPSSSSVHSPFSIAGAFRPAIFSPFPSSPLSMCESESQRAPVSNEPPTGLQEHVTTLREVRVPPTTSKPTQPPWRTLSSHCDSFGL